MSDSELSTNYANGDGLETMSQQHREEVLNIKIMNVRGQVDLNKYLNDTSEEPSAQTDENYNQADLNKEPPENNTVPMTEARSHPLQCAHCQEPATFIALQQPHSIYNNLMMYPVPPQCTLCDQPASFMSIHQPNRFYVTNMYQGNPFGNPVTILRINGQCFQ